MFVEQRFNVLSLSETKLEGKNECEFGCVSRRMPGVTRWRGRKEVALMVSLTVKLCVVERKQVSSRLVWVKVKLCRELWFFVSAYGPSSERDVTEKEAF